MTHASVVWTGTIIKRLGSFGRSKNIYYTCKLPFYRFLICFFLTLELRICWILVVELGCANWRMFWKELA